MISFIIPYTPDREELWKITQQSLADQTDKDFEIIKIDVGSDTNPARAQNEGVDKAKGDIIVLTSPETIQAKHNVHEMQKLPKNTFWIGWVVENYVDKNKEFTKNEFRKVAPMRGFCAKCDQATWADWKYFIGVISKPDYNKVRMDEAFLRGIAYEDRDFALRVKLAGIKAEFNPEICGIHQPHSRKYQDDRADLRAINRDYFFAKRKQLLGL